MASLADPAQMADDDPVRRNALMDTASVAPEAEGRVYGALVSRHETFRWSSMTEGLMNEGGSKRRTAADAAFESVGGSIDCMYYAFGETDLYGICDLPDVASATALSLMINATGALTINLTPLMTVEDVDAAMTKSPSYRPPGG